MLQRKFMENFNNLRIQTKIAILIYVTAFLLFLFAFFTIACAEEQSFLSK